MRGMHWAAVAFLAASSLTRADDADSYALRGPAPEKGQVVVKKSTFQLKNAELTIKIGDKTLEAKQSITSNDEEEIKVMAVNGRQITKALVTIHKDHSDIVTNTGGEDSKESKNGELDGVVIISERTGPNKWKHHLVDEKPTEKQQKELERRAGLENDDVQYPEGKVKVGHAWSIDAAVLNGLIGGSIKDLKGTVKMKFVKLEKVDGEMCAVIEVSGIVKGVLKQDDGDMSIELDMKGTTWRSIKTALDVKESMTGKATITGKVDMDGGKSEITLAGPFRVDGQAKFKDVKKE
jgi:hypothetical protein